jgi:hypothetical protein
MLQLVVAVLDRDLDLDAASRTQKDLPDFVLQFQNVGSLVEEKLGVAEHGVSGRTGRQLSLLFFGNALL